jgi:hypothetical protein
MNMTHKQEKAYIFHKKLGCEYSHDEGDCVIMQLWQQSTIESRVLCAEFSIDQEGIIKPLFLISHNSQAQPPKVD